MMAHCWGGDYYPAGYAHARCLHCAVEFTVCEEMIPYECTLYREFELTKPLLLTLDTCLCLDVMDGTGRLVELNNSPSIHLEAE